MFAIGYLFNILERGSASMIVLSVFYMKDHKLQMKMLDQSLTVKDIQGDLKYDIRSFAYPDEKEIPVLQNIEFTLKPGQTLGLVEKLELEKLQLLSFYLENLITIIKAK